MSRHYTMKDPLVEVEFCGMEHASAKGGIFAIKGFADHCGLWDRVRAEPRLETRRHRGKGYDPVVYVAAVLFSFACGGSSLADCERLNDEDGLKELLGIKRFPDQTSLAEWLRAVGDEGAAALAEINRDLVGWCLQHAARERILHAGELELFFDDTQIEVHGHRFEEAVVNYEGKLSLSWQCLWVGSFLAESNLGKGSRDCSECLPAHLASSAALRAGHRTYLYADSGSSAGKYLMALAKQVDGFSVSYNKWEGPLARAAAELPESEWSAVQVRRWRDGRLHRCQEAYVRHQPEGCVVPQLFVATRHQREEGEMFWQYAFICIEASREGSATLAVERHRLKGDKERAFSEILSDLDLHHPPCQSLAANRVFYALGMIAYNLLQGIKLCYLPDREQPVRTRTLIHRLMLIPVQFKRHARRLKALCSVSSAYLPWWRSFIAQLIPQTIPKTAIT